jgi:hypothetical protein
VEKAAIAKKKIPARKDWRRIGKLHVVKVGIDAVTKNIRAYFLSVDSF